MVQRNSTDAQIVRGFSTSKWLIVKALSVDQEDLKQSQSDGIFFVFNGETGSRTPFIKSIMGAS